MDISYALATTSVAELVSYAMAGGAGYLAWRVVRAYERRVARAGRLAALGDRLRRLEEAVDGVEARVAESAAAQRFATELLLGREAARAPRAAGAPAAGALGRELRGAARHDDPEESSA